MKKTTAFAWLPSYHDSSMEMKLEQCNKQQLFKNKMYALKISTCTNKHLQVGLYFKHFNFIISNLKCLQSKKPLLPTRKAPQSKEEWHFSFWNIFFSF